ncbi:hypothetical protein [Saccharibacillus endophyticus]|uniref:DUF5709 domain-containing protein n=1 Tax=Saccharibacillus endophyticus TaxID=2060666 RepID=A0ABQ1ZU08_9BACL|nr:hypothetical protein [Saccharibacillus endophyticus]GGH76449.1 hypothetical protein GCM10007362_18710 [Saccharibacillus endophyticus]
MAFDPRNESDRAHERFQLERDTPYSEERGIPDETLEYVDTVQEGAPVDAGQAITDPEAYPNRTEEDPHLDSPLLEDVPDADDLHPDSPVDPAAPAQDEPHGTDLLNGAGGEEGRAELSAESEDPDRPLITDGDRETVHHPDNLVTERDTDPENGLFREGSFPSSLPDEVQKNLIDSETDQGYRDEVYTDEDE